MRTIRTKVYKFSELSESAKERVINEYISEDMMKYSHEDNYANWPEYKQAIDKAEEMRTPWFAPSYVWDYCKDDILQFLSDPDSSYEYFENGKLTPA